MSDIVKILTESCSEYISSLSICKRDSYLLRGYKKPIPSFEKFNHDLMDRKPLNTPHKIHDTVNSIFFKKFNWKIRNGVFCYGFHFGHNKPIDLGYGKQYLFFPIGGFDFVYNPDFFDFYHYVTENETSQKDFEKLNFLNDSLKNAIEAGDKEDDLSNEISVKVSSYYLVNPKYREEISRVIWGEV
jgi:hypothetical protein